jgi:hypothetical protein
MSEPEALVITTHLVETTVVLVVVMVVEGVYTTRARRVM